MGKEEAERKKTVECEAERVQAFKQRCSRINFREDEWLKKIRHEQASAKRAIKAKEDRRKEYLNQLKQERDPVFRETLAREIQREEKRQGDQEAIKAWHKSRALEKKEN